MNLELSISGLALAVSAISLFLYIRFRTKLSLSEKIANVSTFLFKEYKNLKFVIPYTVGKRQIYTISDARNVIRDAKEGNIRKNIAGIKDLKKGFSREVSRTLQNIGLLTLLGALPIQFVLPDLARTIVEDWDLCSERRKGILIGKKLTLKKRQDLTDIPIQFALRHAEWLTYASALYLQNYWKGEELDKLLKPLGDIKTIKKREDDLRINEPDVSKETSEEIRKYLYRSRV